MSNIREESFEDVEGPLDQSMVCDPSLLFPCGRAGNVSMEFGDGDDEDNGSSGVPLKEIGPHPRQANHESTRSIQKSLNASAACRRGTMDEINYLADITRKMKALKQRNVQLEAQLLQARHRIGQSEVIIAEKDKEIEDLKSKLLSKEQVHNSFSRMIQLGDYFTQEMRLELDHLCSSTSGASDPNVQRPINLPPLPLDTSGSSLTEQIRRTLERNSRDPTGGERMSMDFAGLDMDALTSARRPSDKDEFHMLKNYIKMRHISAIMEENSNSGSAHSTPKVPIAGAPSASASAYLDPSQVLSMINESAELDQENIDEVRRSVSFMIAPSVGEKSLRLNASKGSNKRKVSGADSTASSSHQHHEMASGSTSQLRETEPIREEEEGDHEEEPQPQHDYDSTLIEEEEEEEKRPSPTPEKKTKRGRPKRAAKLAVPTPQKKSSRATKSTKKSKKKV